MPRRVKSAKWRKDANAAVNEVKNTYALALSPKPSLRALCDSVAVKYQLNASTLHSKVWRSMQLKERAHGNNLLNDSQEARLVGYFLAVEELGVPLAKNQVFSY